MSADLIERPWRCDITGNPVGTDARMIGAPPCDCQGCRAADRIAELEAQLASASTEGERRGCMCRGVEIGSHMAAVALPIPGHMSDYRAARVADDLSPMISVDACLVVELRLLWARGVRTYGSCCGHNKVRGMINVHKDDAEAMRAMGYEQWPWDGRSWEWTFYPKSVRALIPETPAREDE